MYKTIKNTLENYSQEKTKTCFKLDIKTLKKKIIVTFLKTFLKYND